MGTKDDESRHIRGQGQQPVMVDRSACDPEKNSEQNGAQRQQQAAQDDASFDNLFRDVDGVYDYFMNEEQDPNAGGLLLPEEIAAVDEVRSGMAALFSDLHDQKFSNPIVSGSGDVGGNYFNLLDEKPGKDRREAAEFFSSDSALPPITRSQASAELMESNSASIPSGYVSGVCVDSELGFEFGRSMYETQSSLSSAVNSTGMNYTMSTDGALPVSSSSIAKPNDNDLPYLNYSKNLAVSSSVPTASNARGDTFEKPRNPNGQVAHNKSLEESGVYNAKAEAINDRIQGETALQEENEEKRQRRLARNRESARQSRRRKKELLSHLEDKVLKLTAELEDLRKSHLDDANKRLKCRRLRKLRSITDEQDRLSGEELKAELRDLVDKFGCLSDERQAMLNIQSKYIYDLIFPSYTKFLLWVLNKSSLDPGDVVDSQNDKDLWPLVCRELNLSIDQQTKLSQYFKQLSQSASTEEYARLSFCLKYVKNIRQNIISRSKVLDDSTHNLINIMSPEQALLYMNWLENNRKYLEEDDLGSAILHQVHCKQSSESISEAEASAEFDDPDMSATVDLLMKPENELTLADLQSLMDFVDSH